MLKSTLNKMLLFSLFIAGSAFFVQCNGDAERETDETIETEVEALMDAFQAEKDALVQQISFLLGDVDSKLAELGAEIEEAGEEAGEELEQTYSELTEKRSDLEQAIHNLETATEETWEDARAASENLIDEIRAKLEDSLEDM